MTTTDPRADRARFLAADAGQWLKCHTVAGKRYGTKASDDPTHSWLTSTRDCTCPDHRYRGADCAHILAVRLHVAKVRAAQARREVCRHCLSSYGWKWALPQFMGTCLSQSPLSRGSMARARREAGHVRQPYEFPARPAWHTPGQADRHHRRCRLG